MDHQRREVVHLGGRVAGLLFVMCVNGMFAGPRTIPGVGSHGILIAGHQGSLGTTDLMPIQAIHAPAPTMGMADGVDEVHMATVAARMLKATALPPVGRGPDGYRRPMLGRCLIRCAAPGWHLPCVPGRTA